jgi:hypothetical protein
MPRYRLHYTDLENRAVQTLVRDADSERDARRRAIDLLYRAEHPAQRNGKVVILFARAELVPICGGMGGSCQGCEFCQSP